MLVEVVVAECLVVSEPRNCIAGLSAIESNALGAANDSCKGHAVEFEEDVRLESEFRRVADVELASNR